MQYVSKSFGNAGKQSESTLVCIPAEIQRALGITQGDYIQWSLLMSPSGVTQEVTIKKLWLDETPSRVT